MESKYKIAIPRLIPNSTCIAEKYKCNIRLDDNLDTLFATVYGSTAQECESRAMLIVKAEGMESTLNAILYMPEDMFGWNDCHVRLKAMAKSTIKYNK